MQERRINAFETSELRTVGDALKLGLALDLKFTWAETLAMPIPSNLQRLVDRLEERIRRRSNSA